MRGSIQIYTFSSQAKRSSKFVDGSGAKISFDVHCSNGEGVDVHIPLGDGEASKAERDREEQVSHYRMLFMDSMDAGVEPFGGLEYSTHEAADLLSSLLSAGPTQK